MLTPARAILLDVEGTTSPISFVYEILFPYARHHLESFLEEQGDTPELSGVLEDLQRENAADVSAGAPLFPGTKKQGYFTEVAAYCLWLMDRDRKVTPLKTLQGMIWRKGFQSGDLHGEIYEDVAICLQRWHAEGRLVAIYSSGSVLAQKLVFGNTRYGDLTRYICAFFDTSIGGKREGRSYGHIISQLQIPPRDALFVSDITEELDAASAAGLQVALSIRPGNVKQANEAVYSAVYSFHELP